VPLLRPNAPPYAIRPGSRFPPGATAGADGVNFSLFNRHASRVELLLYAAAADGENDAAVGRQFYPVKELVDPWARAVSDVLWDRRRAADPDDAAPIGMRAIVVEPRLPASQATPARPRPAGLAGAVIYELHVGGFTRHPTATVAKPGCFAGMKEKIPYLQALGVTHVELLPVMAFDTQDVPANVPSAHSPAWPGRNGTAVTAM